MNNARQREMAYKLLHGGRARAYKLSVNMNVDVDLEIEM